jgi:hypothetical protein
LVESNFYVRNDIVFSVSLHQLLRINLTGFLRVWRGAGKSPGFAAGNLRKWLFLG